MKKSFALLLGAAMPLLLVACDGKRVDDTGASRGSSLKDVEVSTLLLHLQAEQGAANADPIKKAQISDAIKVTSQRLDGMGVRDYQIVLKDADTLELKIPVVAEDQAEKIRHALGRQAQLGLHKVGERSNELGPEGKSLAERVLAGDEIVVGQRAYTQKFTDMDGNLVERPVLVYRRAALTGADIEMAMVSPQQSDAVMVTLNQKGAEKMIAFTKAMRPGFDRIAIILDGEVVSAPVINQTPLGKRFIIEGLSDGGEPEDLAILLMNPLEVALEVELLPAAAAGQ